MGRYVNLEEHTHNFFKIDEKNEKWCKCLIYFPLRGPCEWEELPN